ncbi:MAG: metallophosphoesterase family protein [Candidatus Eremiobacteraeota bacterium]|nr:metallophosphoesterase family protein [Candidatus Eremiobacteraeota bacterium]
MGLDACLADLRAQGGADAIVGGGDYCMDGPKPKKVLQRLIELDAQCVRGNTDRYIGTGETAARDESEAEQIGWQRSQLGEKLVQWLSDLPFSLRFGEPPHELVVVHANPTSDDEHLWPDAEDADVERLVASESAAVIAFGHLHLPYVRLWRGKVLVNVASAGLPKDGDPRAGYAILTQRRDGWEIKHRRVAFDVKKVATQLRDSGIPGHVEHIGVLRRHRYKQLSNLIP